MPAAAGAPSLVDMKPNTRAAAVVLTLGLLAGTSACAEEEPAVCDDVAALRADLDDLEAIELQPGALAEFSAVLDETGADVDRLVDAAAEEYADEIDAVQSATQALAASVESAAQAPSGPAVTQLSADFGAFTSATESLIGAVEGTC
jgi:hypothetical protein